MGKGHSYQASGVDIDTADEAKRLMAQKLEKKSSRVLNSLGAFASLVQLDTSEYREPVLVLKMEEPGTKQFLAAQHGRLSSVGRDLIHHLINDTVVMGAKPLAILDTVVCGKLESDQVVALVAEMAEACREHGCDLVGGETSEQPGVLEAGSYVLSASCVGVVEKARIVDGSQIRPGNVVLAVASNGVHTNGYSLVRLLLRESPDLAQRIIGGETFLAHVLRPHLCYNSPLQGCFSRELIRGAAHITGGGVADNLRRIIPKSVDVTIELGAIEVLPLFDVIREVGNVDDGEMFRTFNLGVGLIVVCEQKDVTAVQQEFQSHEFHCYPIGTVSEGDGSLNCRGTLGFESR